MYAVVARSGSSRSVRAARARVAAAASSGAAVRIGTTTCSPFAPPVFTAPASPASSRARPTTWAGSSPPPRRRWRQVSRTTAGAGRTTRPTVPPRRALGKWAWPERVAAAGRTSDLVAGADVHELALRDDGAGGGQLGDVVAAGRHVG